MCFFLLLNKLIVFCWKLSPFHLSMSLFLAWPLSAEMAAAAATSVSGGVIVIETGAIKPGIGAKEVAGGVKGPNAAVPFLFST